MACPATVAASEAVSGAWLPTLRWSVPLTLVTHLAWETAQLPLYTIWHEGSTRQIALALLHCTLGDGLIAATTLVLALVLVGHADWPRRRFAEVAAAATGLGAGYTVWSEWLNVTVRGSWAYAAAMPTVPPLGTGLAPLLQWLILPLSAFSRPGELRSDPHHPPPLPSRSGRPPGPPRPERNFAMSGNARALLLSRRAMLGQSAAVALAVPAVLTGAIAAPVASRGFVYTANEKGNSISVVDLAAMRVTTVPIAVSPHNVQASADGRWLLTVGDPASAEHGHEEAEHGDDKGLGRLLVFAAADLARGPMQEIKVGRHPAHVVADQTARYAFVTLAGENAVAAVDLHRELILGRIGTGDYPHGLRISPDGREIHVANVKDGSVSVLDPVGLRELERVPVGEEPVQVGFARDGVYVSLRGESRVAVIDPALRRVVARIPVGRGPVQVYPTPDGRHVYVANQGTEADPDRTVSVIATAERRVVATIRAGEGAHGVVVSDDGAWAFVTNVADGTLTIIDTAANAAVASLPVGPGPNGVTFRTPPPTGT